MMIELLICCRGQIVFLEIKLTPALELERLNTIPSPQSSIVFAGHTEPRRASIYGARERARHTLTHNTASASSLETPAQQLGHIVTVGALERRCDRVNLGEHVV